MKQIYYVIQTLLRGRGSNIIKIISLGLSLTMSILLFSRVAYEQSFDTCYKDYDNLYQIWSVFTVKGEKYPPQEQNCGPVAGAILENFPEQVEAATSTCYWKNSPLYNGNIRFDEKKIVADSLFFQTMGIEVLSGNPVKDLQQPDVIFLSDRFAKKIFGGEDPVGKTINYNHEKDFMVKGTYKALPANATVNPEAVISMPTLWNEGSGGNYSWQGGDSYPEYIRFRSGADKSVVNARIDAMIEKYRPEESKTKYGYTAFVKPIRDTYRNYESVKRMRNIMSVLGFAILFIAALNYVLISISSLTYRAKAVGVHKCNGASGGKIFGMFLLETGIIIVAALLLMALVLLNFREFFEDTAAAKLSLLLAPERIWVPLTVIGVLFIVGGVLPGRLFARIPVSQVFRRYTEGKKGWKRPLLFIQFAGVAFISGLMCVVMAQYQYVLNKDMGYNPQRLALANAYWNKEKVDGRFRFSGHEFGGDSLPDSVIGSISVVPGGLFVGFVSAFGSGGIAAGLLVVCGCRFGGRRGVDAGLQCRATAFKFRFLGFEDGDTVVRSFEFRRFPASFRRFGILFRRRDNLEASGGVRVLFEERRGHLVGQIVVRVNFRRPCNLQNNPCTQYVIRFLFHFSVFFDVRVDFEHGVVPLVGTSATVQSLSQDLVIKSFDSSLFGARIGGVVAPIQVR